jgi:DNA (cytosine-5)-methyltransferase 1
MNFIDLFAGAGFIRRGMEKAGHKCVGYVEIDKYARRSYEAISNTEGEWTAHDITTVTDESIRELGRSRDIHIITGGFPCQAFSIAGSRGGFDDIRGTLFFEIARFASILRPKYLLLENVDGLRSHEEGRTLATILNKLGELNHDVQAQVLNSKDFGVPQNRERIFFVCFNRDFGTESRPQIFPIGSSNAKTLKQIIGSEQNSSRVYDPSGLSVALTSGGGGQGAKTGLYMITDDGPGRSRRIKKDITPALRSQGGGDKPEIWLINKDGDNIKLRGGGIVTNIDANYAKGLDNHSARTGVLEVRPCLTPGREEKRQNGRRFMDPGGAMFTLTAQDVHGIAIYQRSRGNNPGGFHDEAPTITKNSYEHNNHLFDGFRIRKLTPRECWRLQGALDEVFDKAAAVNSDSQLYKQAGNGATENVIYEIARRLT